MNIKEKFFNLFGMYIEKKTQKTDISKVVKKLLPYEIGISLIRLGEDGDGGYLIPNDLDKIDKNYSAGVGLLTKFENDLQNKYTIDSKMLDFNDIKKNILPKNSQFLKKKLSLFSNETQITINDWIDDKDEEIILKIDIEGDEYMNLASITYEKLMKVRILIIELHDLRNLKNLIFLRNFDKIISKLNHFFYPCHLHINNMSKVKDIGGLKIPDMLEITFIRKDRVKNFNLKYSKLPHKLDKKTVKDKDELILDRNWYL